MEINKTVRDLSLNSLLSRILIDFMYALERMEAAFAGKDLGSAIVAMDSASKRLGYSLIAKCDCKDKTRCSIKNEKWRCSTVLDCFHYGKPVYRPEEGIIFSVESFDGDMIEGYKGDMINRRHLEGRRLGIPFLKMSSDIAKETYFTKELRAVDCHVHGNRWNSIEGVDVDTDFTCKKYPIFVETFGSKLHAPPIVKNVSIEQLVKVLQSK